MCWLYCCKILFSEFLVVMEIMLQHCLGWSGNFVRHPVDIVIAVRCTSAYSIATVKWNAVLCHANNKICWFYRPTILADKHLLCDVKIGRFFLTTDFAIQSRMCPISNKKVGQYCKTLYFCCILISRFWNVEISLHFNLAFSQCSTSICQAFDGHTDFSRVFNFVIFSYSRNSRKFDAREKYSISECWAVIGSCWLEASFTRGVSEWMQILN